MMNKIKNIRQRLVEIRNIVKKGGNMTEDQYLTLKTLTAHEHYGIRRQASGLMVTVSKDYRNLIFAGKFNPIAVFDS
jgi:hypothetical protein